MHQRQGGRARREGEHDRPPGAPGQRLQNGDDIASWDSGSASPSPRCGRTGRAPGPTCRPERNSIAPRRQIARRALARQLHQILGDIDRGHARAAMGRDHRQRPGAAAGVQKRLVRTCHGQPGQQQLAHFVPARAHRLANSAHRGRRGQLRPRLDRRLSRSRSAAGRGVRRRWRRSSFEPQKIEHVPVLHRHRIVRLRAGPKTCGQPHVFVQNRVQLR